MVYGLADGMALAPMVKLHHIAGIAATALFRCIGSQILIDRQAKMYRNGLECVAERSFSKPRMRFWAKFAKIA